MTEQSAYDLIDSPVGSLFAVTTPTGLVCLTYQREPLRNCLDALEHDLGHRPLHRPRLLKEMRRELAAYFSGRLRAFSTPIDWSLSPGGFAADVLKVVTTIPWGETLSYGEVAMEAGSPGAARAVGTAMSKSTLIIVVPCHRVIAAGGKLGGYMGGEPGGLAIKRHLLNLEGCDYRP